MTNLTLPDQYFHRFPCQKNYICNCAEFSSTEQLQISFFEIILRHPVATSLIEIIFFVIFKTLKFYFVYSIQTSSHCAVTAQLQLVSYSDMFLPRFYISHIDIYNSHLLHHTNYQNKQKYMFQM